jgi:hypothetical protein
MQFLDGKQEIANSRQQWTGVTAPVANRRAIEAGRPVETRFPVY